ncbi:SpoIIE family protein phosphatase [Desulfovibrio inopinatus]|uniref:SpoIIE family protein phosphatase n=1 Tax=Desulfovibrio inopinatus TaxID=102109 RepID=UPI000407C742|nr:SpoIIE family protein phosphatase [Desulfovibrio inopinatus]
MPHIDSHCANLALSGNPNESGDAGVIIADEDTCFIALIDVLGHGPKAAELASVVQDYLRAHNRENLDVLVQELHTHIKRSRGCVLFVGRLEIASGWFSFTGIGNINAKIFTMGDHRTLLSRDGIVGYSMATPRLTRVQITPRDVIILTSDGVRSHLNLFERPELLRGNAQNIAQQILSQFSKENDDASCLVLRYLK